MRRRLTIDFVAHNGGVAGPWAAGAELGDILVFEGPAGGYGPDLTADWHLMVGDESALPAIAASLEVLPHSARVVVRIICDGAAYEVPLQAPIGADVQWIHRTGDAADSDLLAASIVEVEFPRGRVHGFLHGEAAEIRHIRRHLLGERGLARADMSCSPYWRQGMVDEAWRSIKADFVKAMDVGLTA